MRERRRVIPVKRSEPDVHQFVLALLAMLADRQPAEPDVQEPRELRPVQELDVLPEPGDSVA